MKLPDSQIELAADDTTSRYTLSAIKIDVERKRAMAANGCILAIVPCVVEDGDHSALISIDTVKKIRAMQKRAKSVPVKVTTNGKVVATGAGETAEYELVTGTFPWADEVIPKYEGSATITLDVNLLMRLVKAMTPKGEELIVSLTIKDAQSGVLVKTSKNPDAVGVIMPRRP